MAKIENDKLYAGFCPNSVWTKGMPDESLDYLNSQGYVQVHGEIVTKYLESLKKVLGSSYPEILDLQANGMNYKEFGTLQDLDVLMDKHCNTMFSLYVKKELLSNLAPGHVEYDAILTTPDEDFKLSNYED